MIRKTLLFTDLIIQLIFGFLLTQYLFSHFKIDNLGYNWNQVFIWLLTSAFWTYLISPIIFGFIARFAKRLIWLRKISLISTFCLFGLEFLSINYHVYLFLGLFPIFLLAHFTISIVYFVTTLADLTRELKN